MTEIFVIVGAPYIGTDLSKLGAYPTLEDAERALRTDPNLQFLRVITKTYSIVTIEKYAFPGIFHDPKAQQKTFRMENNEITEIPD